MIERREGILETIYVCKHCGYTRTVMRGQITTAQVPTHCNQVMASISIGQFLDQIQPKRNKLCWQQGCLMEVKTHGTFETPAGSKEYHLCMEHFHRAQQFVIGLIRYDLSAGIEEDFKQEDGEEKR